MSKYFNSIVTCQRDRRWALRAFLRAFSLVVEHIDKDSFEIVITDMDDKNDSLVGRYSDILNINHSKVKYDGVFCRAKALNHAVLHSRGKYITPLDIDSIVTKYFLPNIVNFYSEPDHERVKMCHRIRKLDVDSSLAFMFKNFGESAVESIIERYNLFPINRERYTGQEIICTGEDINDKWLNGEVLGTSQFTILKSIFMEIGGYDENFIGYGCEDLDFNLRIYKFLGGGYLMPDPRCSLYHLCNLVYSQAHGGTKTKIDNYSRYLLNKKNNIILLPILSGWGQF